ncbi:hypothetical protein M5689_000094 [Euphorbia peplus]|nr:hypothetical protein M5689_000094 [Euphorbia peplus]
MSSVSTQHISLLNELTRLSNARSFKSHLVVVFRIIWISPQKGSLHKAWSCEPNGAAPEASLLKNAQKMHQFLKTKRRYNKENARRKQK